MNIIITTLFGLESLTRDDLEAIGYKREQIIVTDGVVTLEVPDNELAKAVARVNMWVRRAERVFFEVGSFKATGFDEFFDKCRKLNWNEFIPKDYSYVVNGFSRKSELYGISALQSLTKKAISKSLLTSRGLNEDGILYENPDEGLVKVQFGIVNNVVRMMIDTSGEGLHKRGYRPLTHEAPIRETLASAMVSLSRYNAFGQEALYDPFCGSGTIVIEAAMMALNIAPGKLRHFSYENLPYIGSRYRKFALNEALDMEDLTPLDDTYFWGSDIDPKAVESAKQNAIRAGVSEFCSFRRSDAETLSPTSLANITKFDRQLIITNPPYGGRLMTPEEADEIYRMIAKTFLTKEGTCKKGIRLSVISPDMTFEDATGLKADKRVKLYNGNIKCQLNNYYKLNKK